MDLIYSPCSCLSTTQWLQNSNDSQKWTCIPEVVLYIYISGLYRDKYFEIETYVWYLLVDYFFFIWTLSYIPDQTLTYEVLRRLHWTQFGIFLMFLLHSFCNFVFNNNPTISFKDPNQSTRVKCSKFFLHISRNTWLVTFERLCVLIFKTNASTLLNDVNLEKNMRSPTKIWNHNPLKSQDLDNNVCNWFWRRIYMWMLSILWPS